MHPSPPPDCVTFRCDPRIALTAKELSWIDVLMPGFERCHCIGATLPQECIAMTDHSFLSYLFESMYYVTSYRSWHDRQDKLPAYQYHRLFLQHLQWRCPGSHWVLKAPSHLMALESLFQVYPDACVVMTHRDPLKVLPSCASFAHLLRAPFAGPIDLAELGGEVSRRWEESALAAMRFRAGASGGDRRFHDVNYLDLLRDPMAVVHGIYRFIDQELATERNALNNSFDSCALRYDIDGNGSFVSVLCLAITQTNKPNPEFLASDTFYRNSAFVVPLRSYDQRPRVIASVPATLNKDEADNFRKSVETINHRIRRSNCQGFLTVYFGREIIETISQKLAEHQAFSGPRSTGINVIDAGLYADRDLARFHKLARSWDAPVAQAATYEMGRSVGQLFADDTRTNGRSISAAVGKYNGNANTAFYRKISALIVLHEILHIVSGLADNALATKLGIDISQFHGDYELASAEITASLQRHGCG
jgi:hypothetical protein